MELFIATVLILQMGLGFFGVIRAVENNTKKVTKKIEENSKKRKEYEVLKETFDVLSIKTTELEMREQDILSQNEVFHKKSETLQNELLEMEEKKSKLVQIVNDEQAKNERLVLENKKYSQLVEQQKNQIGEYMNKETVNLIKRPGKGKRFFKKNS